MSLSSFPAPPVDEGRRYTLKTPAKVNLHLRVTGRRPDGYHNLESLFCGIDLYDILELKFGGVRFSVTCTDPSIPVDQRNLALAAALSFYRVLPDQAATGLSIRIKKAIPVGAGLGGGSSNAAGILHALNQLHGAPLGNDKLFRLGRELGADVPFFLFGRPAWATGIGDHLSAVDNLPDGKLLVVYPGVAVSTAAIFRKLNLGLTKPEKQHRKIPFKARQFSLARDLVNDLETVTLEHYPQVREAKELLWAAGARGVLMSGSGSAVFGIFTDLKEALGAGRGIAKKRPWQTFAVKLLTKPGYLDFVA